MRVWACSIAFVFACGALVMAAGCAKRAERVPEAEEIPGVTPAPGGLRFAVTIQPRQFTIGQRVHMEASLFNDSDDIFKKKYPNGCTWGYEVLTEDGRRAGPRQTCVDSASTEIRLAPGELRMIVRDWRGGYFDADTPLGPGRYEITVGLVDRDARVIPMAEPVRVEIMERRP